MPQGPIAEMTFYSSIDGRLYESTFVVQSQEEWDEAALPPDEWNSHASAGLVFSHRLRDTGGLPTPLRNGGSRKNVTAVSLN